MTFGRPGLQFPSTRQLAPLAATEGKPDILQSGMMMFWTWENDQERVSGLSYASSRILAIRLRFVDLVLPDLQTSKPIFSEIDQVIEALEGRQFLGRLVTHSRLPFTQASRFL